MKQKPDPEDLEEKNKEDNSNLPQTEGKTAYTLEFSKRIEFPSLHEVPLFAFLSL